MKKQLLLGLLLIQSSFTLAQNYMRTDYLKVAKTDEQGVLKFASFKANARIPISESGPLLNEALHLNELNKLILQKSEKDFKGDFHNTYKQSFNGVEVAYSGYRVHSKNGIVTSINGSYNPVSIQTALSELKPPEEIYHLGLSKLGSSYFPPQEFQSMTPKSKLMVLPKNISGFDTDHYAYVFTLVSLDLETVEKVFFDATNGDVLRKESLLVNHQRKSTVLNQEQTDFIEKLKQKIKNQSSFDKLLVDTGNADTRYSGSREITTEFDDSVFVLKDDNRFINTINFGNQDYLLVALLITFGNTPDDIVAMAGKFTDADNNWTQSEFEADKNDGALEAHWAFAQAYDFLKEEYDRNGYDNQNSPVTSFIHTKFFGDGRNAAWMGLEELGYQGGFMFVGDGDYDPATQTGAFDILSGMDAISHEFSHGITNAASGLVYEKESGALNEGFADIWGATIEAKKAPEKEKWLIGEDFVKVAPGAIRSMENPKLMNQPDTYLGINWIDASDACTPGTDNDNCGVHINSGVLNHWYYLLVEGGNGTNDNGYDFNLSGIGIKNGADLVYSVQTNYVQSQSKFADVRDYSIQEAEIMFGEDSQEVISVKEAWCAVGVSNGEDCQNMGLTNFSSSEISIYPNPVSDILNVTVNNLQKNATYRIHNFAGQQMMQSELNQNKINVSLLPPGVYLLSIRNGKQTKSFKFVKK